jgi:hypothetical protein
MQAITIYLKRSLIWVGGKGLGFSGNFPPHSSGRWSCLPSQPSTLLFQGLFSEVFPNIAFA